MFKYKEKMAFTYNIQSVVHCRKFSMKQNVLTIAACFPFEPLEKCMTFKDIFPGLSRTSDFPGLSRSWNFQEKKPGLSRRRGNPVSRTQHSTVLFQSHTHTHART